MSRHHHYEIIINDASRTQIVEYEFGSIKNISLSVEKQKVHIRFETTVLRKLQDILSFRYKDVKDAFRKAFLIHAVLFSKGLEIKRIIIKIDDCSFLIDKEHDPTGHFPYYYSMISVEDLGLNTSWKSLIGIIGKTTKTKAENDIRFSCLYSFLASSTREYEIDRFANLWTAMNAFYSYITRRYEEKLKIEYDLSSLSGGLKIAGRDSESIGLLSWLLDPQYTDISNKDKLRDLWKNNYEVERILTDYAVSDIEELYRETLNNLGGEPLPSKYRVFMKRAEAFNVKPYPFFLLIYPYNLRCKYFHGNIPTILFAAYNDYELSVLRVVNFFISTFLNEHIPRLFKDDFWTDMEQKKAESYIEYITGKSIDILIKKCQKKNTKEGEQDEH